MFLCPSLQRLFLWCIGLKTAGVDIVIRGYFQVKMFVLPSFTLPLFLFLCDILTKVSPFVVAAFGTSGTPVWLCLNGQGELLMQGCYYSPHCFCYSCLISSFHLSLHVYVWMWGGGMLYSWMLVTVCKGYVLIICLVCSRACLYMYVCLCVCPVQLYYSKAVSRMWIRGWLLWTEMGFCQKAANYTPITVAALPSLTTCHIPSASGRGTHFSEHKMIAGPFGSVLFS